MSMTVHVTMTETANYTHEYTLEEFAEMIGVEPTEEAVRTAIAEESDSDYGVEGAEELLDDILEKPVTVSDRDWEISL